MKSSTDEIGGVTLTTDLTILPSQQGLFVTSFGISFSSPVTFGTASGNIMANGMLLLSGMGGVREISPTSDLVYAVNTLSVGADTFMIDNYAIITSHQQFYRFSGTKMTRDASGGTLFINEATRTAVYSMNAVISQFIRNAATPSIPPLSYNLEVVGSNVLINFGDGSFRITGSMLAFDNSAGPFVFTGDSIGSPQLIIRNISEFFEVQESTATNHGNIRAVFLTKQYTDTFTNTATQQALSVNNPRVLSIIRTIMSFSGTVGQFTVTSTGVTFNGVSVMQLMRGSTQSFAIKCPLFNVSYKKGTLTVTSGPNRVIFSRSGVQRVTVQHGSGVSIHDGSAATIGCVGTLFIEKNMAFFTNDTNIMTMIRNQIGTTTPSTQPTTQPTTLPTTPPTTPAAPNVTVRTENGMVIVSIDGMDTVIADSSRRSQITTGQSIRYQNQNIVVFPPGGGNPVLTLMNIGQYVVFNTGDQAVTTFTGSMIGVMAMTGTLYYDGSRALFTNRAEINTAIEDAIPPTTQPILPVITITSLNETVTLNIDGNAVVTLNASRRRDVTVRQGIRYRYQNLIVFPFLREGRSIRSLEGIMPVLELMNIKQLVVYNSDHQTAHTYLGSTEPEINAFTGTLYYDDSRSFFTNRDEIKTMIETALPTPPSGTSSPPSTGTTPSTGSTPSSPITTSMPTTEEPSTSDWSTCVIGPWNPVCL